MPVNGFNGFGMPNNVFNFLTNMSADERIQLRYWLVGKKDNDVVNALWEAIDPTVTIDSSEGVRG